MVDLETNFQDSAFFGGSVLVENMVSGQLRPSGINDERVVSALRAVDRRRFVPPSRARFAYAESEIVWSETKFLPSPVNAARFLLRARIFSSSSVLVLGDGTGYMAALSSHLSGSVVAVVSAGSAARIESTLRAIEVDSVAVIEGEPWLGCETEKPFDVIMVVGCVESLPDAIGMQLVEGGRCVHGERSSALSPGFIVVVTRRADQLCRRRYEHCSLPYLTQFSPPGRFEFT